MLDHMARGRFQWGIGLGGIPTDMKLMGLDPSEARSRAAEALDLILDLWQHEDGKFSHQGQHFKVEAPDLDPETERVLGVGIVGPGAGELIAEGVLAVEMAALVSDVALSIHPHPTLSETVMEAAEAFHGLSPHINAPKRK